jgi:hypothetical protein
MSNCFVLAHDIKKEKDAVHPSLFLFKFVTLEVESKSHVALFFDFFVFYLQSRHDC